MTLLAVCGDVSTTTAYALASMWPTTDVLLVEADASGGDLAAWLDIPEQPGVATAVTMAPTGSWPVIEAQVSITDRCRSSRCRCVLVRHRSPLGRPLCDSCRPCRPWLG